MDNFNNYRNRVLSKGKTNKERLINIKKKSFDNYLKTVPNATEITIDNTTHLVAIQDKSISKDYVTEKYLLSTLESSIKVGDTFAWSDDYWIVTYKESETVESHQGYTIARCNNTLTIQTPDKVIHSIPCIITDRASVYSDGVEDGKYLRLPDGLIKIIIPNNELTNTFDLLNRRIIFDHNKESVYEVTKAGKLLKKGLIEIIAEVTDYDPNRDNLELNLADYIEPDNSIPPEQPENPTEDNYIIQIIGQDSINVITNGTYTTKVYNNGVEVDKEVRFEISDTALATIKSQDEKGCVVVANPNFKLGEVKLKAILIEDETIFAEKTIAVTGL